MWLLTTEFLLFTVVLLVVIILLLKRSLNKKCQELLTADRHISEFQEKLQNIATADNPKAKSVIKPTPLLWMNPSMQVPQLETSSSAVNTKVPAQQFHIKSQENETKYKRLYYKLDEHIQVFSGVANKCLEKLAKELQHVEVSARIRESLADLAVELRRLNPLLNTDKINLTIFGQPRENVEDTSLPPGEHSTAQGLRNVIIQQRGIIMDLKNKLSEANNVNTQEYEEQLSNLEKLLAESDVCIKTLEKELIALRSQLEAKKIQLERTAFLQRRVKDLEVQEQTLKQELIEIKNDCLRSVVSPEKEREFINKIAYLKNEILDREFRINKFKANTSAVENEYQRLFNNYQSLLSKYGVKENDDVAISKLSADKMLEIEELKALLESKEFELDRTQSERTLLETSYLELINSMESLQAAKDELDRLRIENNALGQQLEQVMSSKASIDDMVIELNTLKGKYNALKKQVDLNLDEMIRLKQKEEELNRLRIEYVMMEEQFLSVAESALC